MRQIAREGQRGGKVNLDPLPLAAPTKLDRTPKSAFHAIVRPNLNSPNTSNFGQPPQQQQPPSSLTTVIATTTLPTNPLSHSIHQSPSRKRSNSLTH